MPETISEEQALRVHDGLCAAGVSARSIHERIERALLASDGEADTAIAYIIERSECPPAPPVTRAPTREAVLFAHALLCPQSRRDPVRSQSADPGAIRARATHPLRAKDNVLAHGASVLPRRPVWAGAGQSAVSCAQ